MLVKIHNAYRLIIAICDKELIDKRFEEKKGENVLQLDLTGNFFKGDEKTREESIEIINNAQKEDAIFNVVGEKSCSLMKELGLINEEGIKKIKGIPIALSLG
jgi:hypothetical protein